MFDPPYGRFPDAKFKAQEGLSRALELLEIPRFVAGAAAIAFVPGYCWSRLLFPSAGKAATAVISVVLSLAGVTGIVFYGSAYAGLRVSGANGILAAALFASVPLTVFALRHLRRRLDASARETRADLRR